MDDTKYKRCPCVVCGKAVQVTKFATPSKVRCDEHKAVRPETANLGRAKVDGVVYLDEVVVDAQKAMAAMVRKWGGDVAICPKNPDHDVVIKSVVVGENGTHIVTHQCRDCLTVICYSTQHVRELLPQGVKQLMRDTAGVQWRESRLGTYPDGDVRGISLDEEVNDG